MAYLKFNKSELVNLSYSLKREILCANKTGAYVNTSIVTCNTRRYHGLLAVTLDRFGGDKYLLLSSLDESLLVSGRQFNLGIHNYNGQYEPRGHKYVVDFQADPVVKLTYKVGSIVLTKSIIIVPDADQVLIRYALVEAPSKVTLQLKPFLAFRNIHALTHQNDAADTSYEQIKNGVSFRMYEQFPELALQLNTKEAVFKSSPYWYNGITYSDEYRRGFDCKEDLFVPGCFEVGMKPGESIVFSASKGEVNPSLIKRRFHSLEAKEPEISSGYDQLVRCADTLICDHNGRKKINAGFSWMYTGLLRETLIALPGLTLCAGKPDEFEEILDNLIEDEQDRLFRRTTQVESPLYMAATLQKYIEYGADAKYVWKKYGGVMKAVIESYSPGVRKEVSMQPNGLLWAQMPHVALSWMNAYINGEPVTERAGYQVETNAFWYDALCFAIEMEIRFPGVSTASFVPAASAADSVSVSASDPSSVSTSSASSVSAAASAAFVSKWTPVRDLVHRNFQPVFWNPQMKCLADYVDGSGQHMDIRPNQMVAASMRNTPLDPDIMASVLAVCDRDLVTRRGIRTLSPRDIRYRGQYTGSQNERDLAYHQGSTRPFLLGCYADLSFRVKGPSFQNKVKWLTEGLFADLAEHGVGAFSELYDGDPPHEPHGAISSALCTAALLEVYYLMNKYREEEI